MTRKKEQSTTLMLNTPQDMLNLVAKGQVEASTLHSLLDFEERIMKWKAKQAFDRALVSVQADMPTIKKTKKVAGGKGFNYKYVPLELMESIVTPILTRHGFSHRYDTDYQGDVLTIIMHLSHRDGHTEKSQFSLPVMRDGHMNDMQKVGSTLSYGRRYCLQSALSLVTDDDTDGSDVVSTKASKADKETYMSLKAQLDLPDAEKYTKFEANFGGLDNASETRVRGWISNIEKKLAANGESKLETKKAKT